MAEIINLRRARKAKDRAVTEAQANANRITHGRTKAEKRHSAAELALSARQIDAHKLSEAKDALAVTGKADEITTPAKDSDSQT